VNYKCSTTIQSVDLDEDSLLEKLDTLIATLEKSVNEHATARVAVETKLKDAEVS